MAAPRGKPFQKGVSGNPGGRKPIAPEVKDALRELNPRAIERLRELLESGDERVAMAALKEVLDRNLGKPPQTMALTGEEGADAPAITVRFAKP
jgi:hypothetical protein